MKKNILVLGAGLVAKPLVKYLLDHGYNVAVATRTIQKALNLIDRHPHALALSLNINHKHILDNFVAKADLVISLLPNTLHVPVARVCLKFKKHLITTSYVSKQMNCLDQRAKAAKVIFLNEIGLDPGIDHMSAMAIIHDVQANGGKIISFESMCGGLPAPEFNNNPLGYKFSWGPRGVVLASKNNALYLKDGKKITVVGKHLFEHHWQIKIPPLGEFEVYPNRDSLSYIDKYGLAGIKTMFRGTLRNIGWCETWKSLGELGLLNDKAKYNFTRLTYREFLTNLIQSKGQYLAQDLASYLEIDSNSEIIKRLKWLGLLSAQKPKLNKGTALDLLVDLLFEKMQYQPGEQDMVVLHHKFRIKYGRQIQERFSTLIAFGQPNGYSAMSGMVGLPAAIAARLILEGKIKLTGVQIPVHQQIYEPVLKELGEFGMKFIDKRKKVQHEHHN
ncbi:MAG: saccharopine dehydrogenase C-terminal domain-containing protein [Pseudomonadota bacterium]